jgi:TetR/AcrR family transcriptional repressor of nem operon
MTSFCHQPEAQHHNPQGSMIRLQSQISHLIGDFSLEAAPQSEMLRARLAEIFAEWRSPFAACIGEGQARGEIATTFAPEELAEFLLSSWEGAILRMKVERNADPLERFKRIVFDTVFKEPSI